MEKSLKNLVNNPLPESVTIPLFRMDVNALLNRNTPFWNQEKTNMDIFRELLGDPQLRLLDLENLESQRPYPTDADIPDYMIDYCDSLLNLPRLNLLLSESDVFEYNFRIYLLSADCPDWIKKQNQFLFDLYNKQDSSYRYAGINWRDSLQFFYDAEDHLLLWGRFNSHLPEIVRICLEEYVEETNWPDFKCNYLSIYFVSFKNMLLRDKD